MCVTCTAKKRPTKATGDNPHTYLHALVRCHEQEERTAERSADERIIVVENTVTTLDAKITTIEKQVSIVDAKLEDKLGSLNTTLDGKVNALDERLSRLEGCMERIERILHQMVNPTQGA